MIEVTLYLGGWICTKMHQNSNSCTVHQPEVSLLVLNSPLLHFTVSLLVASCWWGFLTLACLLELFSSVNCIHKFTLWSFPCCTWLYPDSTRLKSTLPYPTVFYHTLHHSTQLFSISCYATLLYYSILPTPHYSIVFHCALPCYTLFYCTPQYSILFYCTLPYPYLFTQPFTTLLCPTVPSPTLRYPILL